MPNPGIEIYRLDLKAQRLKGWAFGVRSRSEGFTLLELMVVIAIIAILMGILLPVVTGMKTKAQIRQAETEVKSLATAIRAYHTEYKQWPVNPGAGGTWSNNNEQVLTWLIAGIPGNLENPRQRNFFETKVPVQALRDPFRSNLCYQVTIAVTNNRVTVLSAGPDCVFGTGDDISAAH